MKDRITGLQQRLTELEEILVRVRPLAKMPLPTDPMYYTRNPAWQDLSLIPGSHCLLLAHIELLLEGLYRQRDTPPSHTASQPHGYWTAGAISQGVLDHSTKLGLITSADHGRLTSKHAWDQKEFDMQRLIDDLSDEIAYLRDLLRRLENQVREPDEA